MKAATAAHRHRDDRPDQDGRGGRSGDTWHPSWRLQRAAFRSSACWQSALGASGIRLGVREDVPGRWAPGGPEGWRYPHTRCSTRRGPGGEESFPELGLDGVQAAGLGRRDPMAAVGQEQSLFGRAVEASLMSVSSPVRISGRCGPTLARMLDRGRVDDLWAGVVAGAGHDRAGGGRARAATAVCHQLHGPWSAVRDAGGPARRPHRAAATRPPYGLDPARHGPHPDHRPDGQRLFLAVNQSPRGRPSRHRAGDLGDLLRLDAVLRPRSVPAAAVPQRAAARTGLAAGRLGRRRRHGGPHRRLGGPGLAGPRDHAVPEHARERTV